jgi:hypothetical protein
LFYRIILFVISGVTSQGTFLLTFKKPGLA